ncbi:MAG: 50S ribosomal protein L4 [Cyclobacteriaceae bacterium]
MKITVKNIKGEDTGNSVELNDDIYAIEPNEHALYLDVKHYLANQRQGTHKSKERAEIAGSTRKIKKQKGTGTARAGSLKSPVFRGGGRVFGPRPRDYSFKLNKKLKKLARKSALSLKAKNESITILENFSFDAPKTSQMVAAMQALEIQNKKVLLILGELDKNVYLSTRNLPQAKVTTADKINTYDLMNAQHIILNESAVSVIESMFNQTVTV